MAALIAAAKAMKATANAAQDSSSIVQTQTIQSGITTTRVGCPFNLDEIFQADVDRFGKLKEVLGFIFDNLEKTNGRVSDLDTKLVSKFMVIDKINTKVDANKTEVDQVNKIMKELIDKSCSAEEEVQELKSDVEGLRLNLHLTRNKVKDHTEKIKELEGMMGGAPPIAAATVISGGSDIDVNALGQLFASQGQIKDLEMRLADIEKHDSMQDSTLNNHEEILGSLQDMFHNLEKQMTQKLKQLEGLITGMASAPTGDSSGNVDMGQFQMILNKIQSDLNYKANQTDMDQVVDLLKRKADKQEMHKEVERLESMIGNLNQVASDQSDKQISLEKEVENLKQFVEMLQRSINGLKAPQQNATPQQQSPQIDEGVLRQVLERLAQLENEFMNLREEFSKWVKDLQDSLNLKADLDTVTLLEKSLMDRLNEIVKALSKQFADKNDTRKALKLLEKNLKNMYDLFMSKSGNQDNADDALFTTKPLGGTSCASCAKDIIDMYGKKVDYLPWGKLPFRDPSERIARVGQGFSKMLSMINPDQMSKYEGNQISQEGLPQGYSKNLMRPPAQKSQMNYNQANYKQTGFDANRPASAQVPQRPFTRGASKGRKGY